MSRAVDCVQWAAGRPAWARGLPRHVAWCDCLILSDACRCSQNKTVTGLTGGIEGLFKKYKVDYYKGTGEIKAAGEVRSTPPHTHTPPTPPSAPIFALSSMLFRFPSLQVAMHPIDGSDTVSLKAKNIVIASGSEPSKLPGVPVRHTYGRGEGA